MSDGHNDGLGDLSLFELFRMEAEDNLRVIQDNLLALEREGASATLLEELMRGAHSIKGAARIVGLDPVVSLTHALEDRFVAAQAGLAIDPEEVDTLLAATDWLSSMTTLEEDAVWPWLVSHGGTVEAIIAALERARKQAAEKPETPAATVIEAEPAPSVSRDFFEADAGGDESSRDQTVRLSTGGFDRIVSLASESLVLSNHLSALPETLDRNWRTLTRITAEIRALDAAGDGSSEEGARRASLRADWDRRFGDFQHLIQDLDRAARDSQMVSARLHTEILGGRLRPFSEGTAGFQRLVRDLAAGMGKAVTLVIEGTDTLVDREVLDSLKAPLTHLLQNAVDHASETSDERIAAGKPAEARLQLNARHENGQLVLTVADDGRGIDRDALRRRVVERDLASADTVALLSDAELLEFIFLPGFSTRTEVSEVSGRGFGLNVVQAMVHAAGGSVAVRSVPGRETSFMLTLPVTRSMVRTVRLRAGSETFAAPLVRIEALRVATPEDRDGKLIVEEAGRVYPVVSLSLLLGQESILRVGEPCAVLLVGKVGGVAFQVDKILDQVELAVRKLDARLGKIPGISSVAIDEDGWPLLILDVEALMQTALGAAPADQPVTSTAAHILVVDDSATVREQVRRTLIGAGYRVSTAQHGREAWNLLRTRAYDLLLSDVDMPQMNGIELTQKVRESAALDSLHVVLLSYKDRPEDRMRGLEAGADAYLTKGSFEQESFLRTIEDLVGKGEAQ